MRFILILFLFPGALSAEESKESSLWQPYQKILDIGIKKNSYSGPLGKFTHNAFDYKLLKNHKDYNRLIHDQRTLLIKSTPPSNRYEKLAFWINAYNFFTIVDVCENFPIESMKDLGWKNTRHNVGGTKYSLDDIEHKILRPIQEPKIHFAINCASVSCPSLHEKVFEAKSVGLTMKKLTENAFKNPLHLQVNGDEIEVTKLFSWFEEDFEIPPFDRKENFIKRYTPPKLHKKVDGYLVYNWELNTPENIEKAMKLPGLSKE